MADRLDVADRIAEGRPAVEHTQRYVRASAALGYHHPDLTAQAFQIHDWYGSEEGLNLHALDADCAELRAAGAAAMEALRIQRGQIAELTAAWSGPGADSAVAFLERHCDAASMVVNELRAAAQRCESLRDNLWYLLDVKVATAIAIDDRTAAQRSVWLAAADAVTTGAVDRQAAQEVVHEQVIPFVDNDIRDDWVNAMRSTQAGVAAAYDMVTDGMAAEPLVQFEIPAEFVPGRAPFQPVPPSAPAAPASLPPNAVAAPPDAAPAPPTSPARAAPPSSLMPAMPAMPPVPPMPLPDLGTALGEAGGTPFGGAGTSGTSGITGPGGLTGLADRIVNAMGSLLDGASDEPGDAGRPGGTDDPFGDDDSDEDAFHEDRKKDPHDKGDKPGPAPGTKPDLAPQTPPPDGPPPEGELPVSEPPKAQPQPPDVAAPAPVPLPAPTPELGASTPCQTAPDQLPQAGA